ncbi:MAG: biotin transporter BioY, partial [Bacteroidota bacterium]|nr:biotin transporter BioY [Bacteroidota bacterium]
GLMVVIRKNFVIDSTSRSASLLAQAGWIYLFAALTAIGAQVQIPHQPIPFTLQTFFVLLSGAFLGVRNGFIAQLCYIAIGAIGLPVFTGATFGLVKIFGLTGGYLLSFPIAAALIGYLVTVREGYAWTIFSMFLGLVVVFTSGSLYLNFIAIHNIQQSLISGFLIFSWWDILKLTAAAAIYNEFAKRYRKLPA